MAALAFAAAPGSALRPGVPKAPAARGAAGASPQSFGQTSTPRAVAALGALGAAAAAAAGRRAARRAKDVRRRDVASLGGVLLPLQGATAAPTAPKLELPNFGVGAWAWGDRLFWGYDEKQDQDLRAGFETLIKGGVKLFDTAEIYGPGRSEELLGKFLRETGAKDVQVATKFAAFPWKLDRSDVVKACKGSLERLGMKQIDLYQIHFPSVWKNEVFWDGLADCFDQGLVKAVGVSNYGSEAVRAISKTLGARGIPLTSNQIQYSLVYRFPELNGMKATCDELGVKILAYSPLGLGALTGKWTETSLPDGPRAQIAKKLLKDPNWTLLLDAMKDVAKQHGKETTLSQVAIAWCIAKGTTPIPGVRNVRQAEDNLRAISLKLTNNEVVALDSAAAKVAPYIEPSASPFNSLRQSIDTKQAMYEA